MPSELSTEGRVDYPLRDHVIFCPCGRPLQSAHWRLGFSPLDLVAPSKLGTRSEVFGNWGTVTDIVAPLVVTLCHFEGNRREQTVIQRFASVLRTWDSLTKILGRPDF